MLNNAPLQWLSVDQQLFLAWWNSYAAGIDMQNSIVNKQIDDALHQDCLVQSTAIGRESNNPMMKKDVDFAVDDHECRVTDNCNW